MAIEAQLDDEGKLRFDRGTPRRRMRDNGDTTVVVRPKKRPMVAGIIPRADVEELLMQEGDLPWWTGLGLLAMALAIPEGRRVIGRLIHLVGQMVLWAGIVIITLATIALWVVALVGNVVVDALRRALGG